MSIKRYNEKRDFGRTPEPAGKSAPARGKSLRFVVQKHQASRLHYDFRLEMDGVLKSWAVPKGPSLDPADKRLAMHVEDHPMDYRLFEGVIPPGNYGAGSVIVWDEGSYHAAEPGLDRKAGEKALLEGLAKGKLTFCLEGRKLRGEFALVKMRGRKTEDNAWLLVKADDEAADTDGDVRDDERSVLSRRSLDEVAGDSKAKVWRSNKEQSGEATAGAQSAVDWGAEALAAGGNEAPFPDDARPQLATLVDAPFNREGWLFEIKWDGYRALGLHRPGKRGMSLVSRNGKAFDAKFPAIAEALRGLPCEALVDGELTALDKEGNPSFSLVQNHAENGAAIVYYLFDLLYLDGVDLRQVPLVLRKQLLEKLLAGAKEPLRYSDHVADEGVAFFELAGQRQLEGIIAKDGQAAYQNGRRSRHWLKIKVEQRQEFVIAGYTAPRRSRSDIGSLVLAYYDAAGTLHFAGHVGSGLDADARAELKRKLDRLARKTPPFAETPDTNESTSWATPKLVCEVRFSEKTPHRHLRHPVYLGLREDKDPTEIRWETGEDAGKAVAEAEREVKKKRRPSQKPPGRSRKPRRKPAMSAASTVKRPAPATRRASR